jgi:hypothetical protein
MIFLKKNEEKTLIAMFRIYCGKLHNKGEGGKANQSDLCQDCQSLFEYAKERLEKCPHGERKPVCGVCKIHCYKPEMRLRITHVMRYAGPRMLFRHPVLTFQHLLQRIVVRDT